ncbi:SETD3 family histone-lysine N-methyltransferase, partial [Streptomyces sp. tea 10]|nr:SETD3 family histone-lysine N-methyltransferase [Streptomyces sp. tea 10]
TPEEFKQRQLKNRPAKPAMDGNEASLLFKILQTKQAQYGTSLEHDTKLLATLQSPQAPKSPEVTRRRLKMALQVRIGEKEIIQAALAMLEPLVGGGSLKRTANGDSDESRNAKTKRV